jgi:hypothetical protein
MPKVFPISQDDYFHLSDESGGICLHCGTIQSSGVEPDARNYGPCENCEEMMIFGMEEALLMGRIFFKDDDGNGEDAAN